ncbi:MAG: molybdenum cofactor biosynthesis protein B [Phycisphaerales bacterium]
MSDPRPAGAPAQPIRAAVLTVSDRCSRGQAEDTSGPALTDILRSRLGAVIVAARCLPDEADQLARCFVEWSRPQAGIDLVLSTGGTGLAPRDVTPEAARRVLEREHSGLMELARLRCMSKTPRTFLSRGIAGTIGRTLILTLPGSPRGATENLEALLDILPHAIETLRGEVQDDGRPDATALCGKVIRHDR